MSELRSSRFFGGTGAMCRDGSFHLVGDGHGQLGGIAKARKASAPKDAQQSNEVAVAPLSLDTPEP